MQSLIKIARLLEKDAGFFNVTGGILSNLGKGVADLATGKQFMHGYRTLTANPKNMSRAGSTFQKHQNTVNGVKNMLVGGAKTLGMYGTGLYGGYKMFS